MEITQHSIEPWLVEYVDAPYNLAESGMVDQTLGELLALDRNGDDGWRNISLINNPPTGTDRLRAAIASSYGTGVEPHEIVVTTGASEALLLILATAFRQGDNIVVPAPAFPTFVGLPPYLGYEVRRWHFRSDKGFRPDLNELVDLVDSRTSFVVVNTPHNPTGIKFLESELKDIADIAAQVGARVLIDEHYRYLTYSGVEPEKSFGDRLPNAVAVGSMIKCFGCVGLRLGWLIADSETRRQCIDLKDYVTHSLSPVSDYLGSVVLENVGELSRKYSGWVQQNLGELTDLMKGSSDVLAWQPPEGGLACFPWMSDGSTGREFAEFLVADYGVSVLPGDTLGYPRHFRLGLGLEPETFRGAMAQIDRAIEQWKSR
jgi:aspartate/methionine/tyrosine aminotransferase